MKTALFFSVVLTFLFLLTDILQCQEKGVTKISIKITSTAFIEGGLLPKIYTCEGKNISPPLAWSNLPEGTKSIALINDDPDAPMGTWVHWVIYNIPPTETGLKEEIPSENILPNGAKQGITDFRRVGYGGPCPPSGTHRYFFKLYALDKILELEPGVSKGQLLTAMEGHILGTGQLVGKYKKAL
ncbi:MAG: YbhB/YbcL family Raf kinase inhibitor-like protein [Bacteroidetes bacterium]|nr:YbhB/YbcL family Raf kinase inhibitor-like protein [Bacteroidota bacterium]